MAERRLHRWMVLGLGRTGQSVVRWLAARGESAVLVDERTSLDTAALEHMMPAADIVLGSTDAVSLEGVQTIVTSPGFAPSHDLLQRAASVAIPIISDIELFCQSVTDPIVAVTGSDGKSTVVSLLKQMCDDAGIASRAGANLGEPALDLISDDIAVTYLLELSSFQLDRTGSLTSLAACVLNLSEDHLDWHGTLDDYRAAKMRIYEDCEFAIINGNAPELSPADDNRAIRIEFVNDMPGQRQFGVGTIDGERCLMFGDKALIAVNECALTGEHNIANMLAALAIGSAIDLPLSAMRRALQRFRGLEHRHQAVGEYSGVRWINDSKATNIGASLASVAAVSGPVVLLLGGRAKGETFETLAQQLPPHVRVCVVYGENRQQLANVLTAADRPFQIVPTLDDAVEAAASIAQTGDTVLLAPAAASQDAFRDYRARGEHFVDLVRERCA
ncbi:MAG: UDP-N-acetylmuramoyl-L-alanine--D-glutamate ligase [Pseudomonadota bacterium]